MSRDHTKDSTGNYVKILPVSNPFSVGLLSMVCTCVMNEHSQFLHSIYMYTLRRTRPIIKFTEGIILYKYMSAY